MTLVVKDRVKETTTTTGTGAVTLGGAAAGFQAFSVIGNGNTTYYAIVDLATGDWEVGLGTYTLSGTILARTTVLSSSNSGSAVNFGAGLKDVFVTYPADKAVIEDSAGNVGIGTSAPSALGLQVTKGSGVQSGFAMTNPANSWAIQCGASTKYFAFQDQTAGERMRISEAGFVGIGNSNPTQKLDVTGTVKATAFTGDGSGLTGVTSAGKAAVLSMVFG